MAAGGAGPLGSYCQAVRRFERDIAARRARRAALHSAMRKAGVGGEHTMRAAPAARAEHPCFHLCLDCGYFGDHEGNTCPACGGPGWVDLSVDRAMDEVSEVEGRREAAVSIWVKVAFAVVLASAIASWTLWLPTGVSHLAILATIALALPVYALCRKPVDRLLRPAARRGPARWHGPVAPAEHRKAAARGRRAAGSPCRGPVTARSGGLLSSPFGGVSCVAYEIAIKELSAGEEADRWLLSESRSLEVEVGDRQLAADTAILALPLAEVSAHTPESLTRYLRERGLSAEGRDLELYEAVLCEGQVVEATPVSTEATVVTDPSIASDSARRAGPYR